MMTSIIKSAGSAVSKVGFNLHKHSPEILVIAGVAGAVVGAVMACKATTKATEVLEETKAELDKVNTVLEDEELSAEYSEEDHKKDLAIIYTKTGIKLAKLYAPSIIIGGLSIASILCGHNILRGRNVALAAAYATVDRGFKEYRNRVADRFGEEVDYQLRNNLKAEEITNSVVDEKTGKTKKVKETVLVKDSDIHVNGYARMFDAGCDNWANDANLNRYFLTAAQTYFNDKLQHQGYLFLSEVYKYFHFRETPESRVVGWLKNGEDGFVDFGFDQDDLFMSGRNKDTWLNFNVDGPILNTFSSVNQLDVIC